MKEPGPIQKTLLGVFFLFLVMGNLFKGCTPPPPEPTPKQRQPYTGMISVVPAGSGWLVIDQYEGGVAFVPSSAGWDGVIRTQ